MLEFRTITLDQLRAMVVAHAGLVNARRISAIHLHHTWRPRRGEFRGRATMEGMRRYHVERQGWSDIAQHLTIDPEGGLWLGRMADMDCDALGVDWTVSLRTARQVLQGHDKSLQGNIDPNVLFAPATAIEEQVRAVLDDFGSPHRASFGTERGCGHIFNLGHGINQYTPPEAVKVLVDEVHRYSKLQRQAAV